MKTITNVWTELQKHENHTFCNTCAICMDGDPLTIGTERDTLIVLPTPVKKRRAVRTA